MTSRWGLNFQNFEISKSPLYSPPQNQSKRPVPYLWTIPLKSYGYPMTSRAEILGILCSDVTSRNQAGSTSAILAPKTKLTNHGVAFKIQNLINSKRQLSHLPEETTEKRITRFSSSRQEKCMSIEIYLFGKNAPHRGSSLRSLPLSFAIILHLLT